MADLAIVPVLILGIILAIIELIFVHQDEAGMHWFTHAMHAVPVMFLFLFVSMNVEYVIALFKWPVSPWIIIGVRVLVGLIAVAKIQAAAAVAGKVGEKMPHTLIIAALIVLAPYIWEYALCGIGFIKTLPMHGCPAPTTP
jgi:hypothetical protein